MADTPTINVPVTVNLRESLARELREAADALDPKPVYESLSAEWLSLRWPPTDEAIETVARALCVSREHLEDSAVCPSSRRDARAALEALGNPDA